jgi:hypothetical protein
MYQNDYAPKHFNRSHSNFESFLGMFISNIFQFACSHVSISRMKAKPEVISMPIQKRWT